MHISILCMSFILDCVVKDPHGIRPEVLCVNDQLVVRWPTDTIYGGNTASVPADVATRLSKSVSVSGIDAFKMVVTNQVPP